MTAPTLLTWHRLGGKFPLSDCNHITSFPVLARDPEGNVHQHCGVASIARKFPEGDCHCEMPSPRCLCVSTSSFRHNVAVQCNILGLPVDEATVTARSMSDTFAATQSEARL